MYPVLFRIGRLAIPSYTALLDIGLLGGAFTTYLRARRRGIPPIWLLDLALVAALCGLIGGRAIYVVAHWAYYGDHLHQALRPWHGGLAWHGGLTGGLVGALAYCALRRRASSRWPSLWQALDILMPGVAMVSICAWLGCLLTGSAQGIETHPGQGLLWALSMELPDLYGLWTPRVATQLLGAGWSAVALIVVFIAGGRAHFEGLLFLLWLALYTLGSFALGFVRADQVPLIAGWRADQIANLALTSVATLTLTAGLLKRQAKEAQQ